MTSKKNLFRSLAVLLLPPLAILTLTVALQGGKNILDGIYILFPLLFLIQAILSTNPKQLLLGMLLSTAAFLPPINLLYHMGSGIDLLTIYLLLATVGYLVKRAILKKQTNKKQSA